MDKSGLISQVVFDDQNLQNLYGPSWESFRNETWLVSVAENDTGFIKSSSDVLGQSGTVQSEDLKHLPEVLKSSVWSGLFRTVWVSSRLYFPVNRRTFLWDVV